MELDTNYALSIIDKLIDFVIENQYEEAIGADVNVLNDLSLKLEADEGLLDDFKAYYSMDVITRLRGKNKLTHLEEFCKKVHSAE